MSTSSSNILSSVYSASYFDSTLENSRLIVKQAMAKRMEKELADLNEKYDGKKAGALEEQINALADQKQNIADYLSSVETAQKRMDSVRTALLSARDAVTKGSTSAFDLYVNSINSWIGNQGDDPKSLIANNGSGNGQWRSDTTFVSGAGQTVQLTHQFAGNDYDLIMDDGSVLQPDSKGVALIGKGETKFSDLSLSHLATLKAGDGSTISGTILQANGQTTFTDENGKTYTGTGSTLTDTDGNSYALTTGDRVRITYADGRTADGTLKTGGLGMVHSWGYGDFNSSDPTAKAAAQQAAYKAIDAAIRKLGSIESNLYTEQAGLQGIGGGIDGKSAMLSDEYDKVANEELTAKQAERRAIETRFQMATNSMALANQTASALITQMFNTSATYEAPDLTDIMLSQVSGK